MEAMQREKIFLFFCSYVIMSLIENGRMEWCEMLELKRMVYEDLMKWKVSNTGKVLEVNGARQVGKTYILDKFAKENYKQYLYINMTQTSGKEFLQCLEAAIAWKPGEKVYLLKGDIYGGIADKKITVPIYLTGRIEFA